MPFTDKQKRLFFAKARRGEMDEKDARKYAREPTKRDDKKKRRHTARKH